MLDSSSQAWDHGTRRIWSLQALLSLHAPVYLNIARICEEYTSSAAMQAANPNAAPTDEQLLSVLGHLQSLQDTCSKMQLHVSARSMARTILEFKNKRPTMGLARQRYLEWYSCFESEVGGQIYLLVLPHRAGYLSFAADDLEGFEISKLVDGLNDYPNALYDAREAGNCFALERFTACVYHLMRVAEFGLVSIARTVGVEEEKINKGWDGCLHGIQSEINKISSTKPTPDWQGKVKSYNDLCSWLTAIQKGWRNPVSHVPRIYSEDEARSMFAAIKTLFDHIKAQGFKEVAMPDLESLR
jgi:hypothetical protein